LKDVLSVGEISASPGEKSFGYLKIGETPTTAIELPIGVLNGAHEGPRICIVAGTHPMEYPGIDAAIRIYNEIDLKELHGSIVTVPVVNVLGFDRAISYVCPLDGLNMAFQVPGKELGTFSQITNYHLEKIVYASNYFMDLHGAELSEMLVNYTIYFKTGNESVDRITEGMARVYGTDFIEQRTESGAGRVWPTSTIFVEAPKRGIPAIVAEAGVGLGSYNESDIQLHVDGVKNVLKFLKMIPGEPKSSGKKLRYFNDVAEIRVRRGGLFYPLVKLTDLVKRSQVIGVVKNLKGEIIEEVTSPEDGFTHLIVPRHVVNTSDIVFYVGLNLRDA